jgi:hypothetical protein
VRRCCAGGEGSCGGLSVDCEVCKSESRSSSPSCCCANPPVSPARAPWPAAFSAFDAGSGHPLVHSIFSPSLRSAPYSARCDASPLLLCPSFTLWRSNRPCSKTCARIAAIAKLRKRIIAVGDRLMNTKGRSGKGRLGYSWVKTSVGVREERASRQPPPNPHHTHISHHGS